MGNMGQRTHHRLDSKNPSSPVYEMDTSSQDRHPDEKIVKIVACLTALQECYEKRSGRARGGLA